MCVNVLLQMTSHLFEVVYFVYFVRVHNDIKEIGCKANINQNFLVRIKENWHTYDTTSEEDKIINFFCCNSNMLGSKPLCYDF